MWRFLGKTSPETERRLEDRVAALEKRFGEIEVEWSEWYDKYRRLFARIAKRVERDEKGSESRDDPPRPTNTREPSPHPSPSAIRRLRGF